MRTSAWANLADVGPTLPGGGVLDDLLHPKPAFAKLQQIRERFRPQQPPPPATVVPAPAQPPGVPKR